MVEPVQAAEVKTEKKKDWTVRMCLWERLVDCESVRSETA